MPGRVWGTNTVVDDGNNYATMRQCANSKALEMPLISLKN